MKQQSSKYKEIYLYRWEFLRRNPEFRRLWERYPHWSGGYDKQEFFSFKLYYNPKEGGYLNKPKKMTKKEFFIYSSDISKYHKDFPIPPKELEEELKKYDLNFSYFFQNDINKSGIAPPSTGTVSVQIPSSDNPDEIMLGFNINSPIAYRELKNFFLRYNPEIISNIEHFFNRKRVVYLTSAKKLNLDMAMKIWDHDKNGLNNNQILTRLQKSTTFRSMIKKAKNPMDIIQNRRRQAESLINDKKYKELRLE